ncbi:ammonia-forming cytochrome c nitrite reductase subunit c552 [Holophaga foetida]|uniref:ammonia-forming cytochrome c nitrite reductase subunit c552 n=1 Tax=Holophaga foetida TaxID=35839 RepID=UPI00024750DA|nr:ammonia-forming cytochrome c nitrite reductase subunit c552 [Holophaga foetida]
MTLSNRTWFALFIAAALVAFGLGLLATGLGSRQEEAPARTFVTPIGDQERDPAVWGMNFPLEYRNWQRSSPAQPQPAAPAELFAGYGFARDFNRTRSGFPDGQHPATCLDCHDPRTMKLRVGQKAFSEALARRGVDLAKASDQDLRTYVCAQCHSTYTFRRDEGLDFPHEKGLKSDEILKALEERGVTDWTHGVSGTPMVKLRGPAYELGSQGVHAFRGVTCSDCHMPYIQEEGTRIASHQLHRPLRNPLEAQCIPCHRWPGSELKARVEDIQSSHRELQKRAEAALLSAHQALAKREIPEARTLLRRAQAHWDFVASEGSDGFHAPQEAARNLAMAIDLARQAELTVRSSSPAP